MWYTAVGLILGAALLCWESNPETQVSMTPCIWMFVHGRANPVSYITGNLGHQE